MTIKYTQFNGNGYSKCLNKHNEIRRHENEYRDRHPQDSQPKPHDEHSNNSPLTNAGHPKDDRDGPKHENTSNQHHEHDNQDDAHDQASHHHEHDNHEHHNHEHDNDEDDHHHEGECNTNAAPVAVIDSFTGNENTALVLAASVLLANDTDANGDTLTVTSVQAAVNGTVTLVNGVVTFTPAPNYNGPASFTYTISDGKGGTDTATVSLELAPALHPIEVTSLTVSVSEEALLGGLQDSAGSPDTTNASGAEGVIQVANASGNVTFTLTQPAEVLTSGGLAVIWQGDGTQQLIAKAGESVVATVNIDNAGNYAVNLLKPIDHGTANLEDIKSINIGINVASDTGTAVGALTVNIEDDAPVALNKQDSFALIDTNLLIKLDTSASMNDGSGIGAETRLQSAVHSIERLFDIYDGFGEVKVRLVTFSNNAQTLGSEWVTVSAAKAMLDGILTTGGTTNYDGALANAMTAFTEPGKIEGAQNISYFFSDGTPNRADSDAAVLSNVNSIPGADSGIQGAEEAIWKDFLNTNQIKSFAIGMGTGITDVAYLNPIAYDGQAQQNITGVVVQEMGELDGVLASTVSAFPGQLLSGGLLSVNSGVGADGGYVKSITIEGVTYVFDPVANTVSNVDNGLAVFSATTKHLSVALASGGQFVVDMGEGGYQYQAPTALTTTIAEHFDYVIVDNDGDEAAASVQFDVDKANITIGTPGADTLIGINTPDLLIGREGNDQLQGAGGKDVLLGGDGDDTLSGGAASDLITGGLGADTFVWALADAGAKGAPAIDVITDFDTAPTLSSGDALDLRDLLIGENHTAGIGNLSSYLHFEKAGADTVIHISSTGDFSAAYSVANDVQNISLLNVDLLAGLSDDQAVIQNLLSNNKLIVD